MSTDDLTSPLKRAGSGGLFSKLRLSRTVLTFLIFAIASGTVFGWYMLNRNPLGGEPRALTKIKSLEEKQAETQAANTAKNTPDETAEGTAMRNEMKDEEGSDTGNSAEPVSQKSEENTETPPDRIIISGGKEAQGRSSRPLTRAPIDGYFKRISSGLLPQIPQSGKTPAQAYARPLSYDVTSANKDNPRIAILITGLGISPAATGEAIRKLPGAVSFAFAPYAHNLQSTVSKARNNGHEVMLQLPMEPFDYPDNDPGPHTLLADTTTRENNARIEWLLTRFTGYTGVSNYMGAKFTATPDAVKPFLQKIKEHGLFYFEDGASPRSQSSTLSKSTSTSFSKASLVIDGEQNNKSIRQSLLKLENIARDKGLAIGTGSALPVTIDALSEWSKSLQDKNIVLIPISATALSKK